MHVSWVLMPAVFALAACRDSANNVARSDSVSGVTAMSSDTFGTQGRLANDATLGIETTPPLHEVLRAAADSFASREAIRVVLTTPAAITAPEDRAPDLIVLAGDDTLRLRTDSTAWTLLFAEMDSMALPDTAVRRDSANIDTAAKQKPARRRGTRGKSPDTSETNRRSAADSARLAASRRVILTIPANAPNSAVAERFVRYLLVDGRATLLRAGLHVLPRLEVRGSGVPPGIVSLVDTVLPADTNRAPQPPPGR
jgi:hypothetical protein